MNLRLQSSESPRLILPDSRGRGFFQRLRAALFAVVLAIVAVAILAAGIILGSVIAATAVVVLIVIVAAVALRMAIARWRARAVIVSHSECQR